MEQCNDGAGFTNKSLQDLRNISTDWNLNGDRALLEILENIHKDVITKVNKTNENHEKLAIDLNKASLSLININNRFSELCNTQFIENKVQEDDITVNNENEQKSCDKTRKLENTPKDDDETKEQIVTAISTSLLELKGLCDEISLSSDSDSESDDSDSKAKGYNSVILKPKDVYAENYLPHIIGSNKWRNKWHIGLRECSSDSESDEANSKQSPHDEYSSSDESTKESLKDDQDSLSIRKKQMTLPIRRDNTSSNASTHDDNISDKMSDEIFKADHDTSNVKNNETKAPPIIAAPSDIAAELARKFGSNVADPLQTVKTTDSNNKIKQKPIAKKSTDYSPILSEKPSTRITGNIFSDEPPPLESSNDDKSNNIFDPGESTDDYVSSGLFGDKPDTPPQSSNRFFNASDLFGKNQTSNYGGLFDDVPDDDDDTFGESNIKKKQTLYKPDRESGNKINKTPQTNVPKLDTKKDVNKKTKINTNYNDGNSLFDDDDAESDDNLFGPPKKIQTSINKSSNENDSVFVKTTKKPADVKKVRSLFDDYSDSDDDLFGSGSKNIIKSVPQTTKKPKAESEAPIFEPKKNVDKPIDNKFMADSDDDLFGSDTKNKIIATKKPFVDTKPTVEEKNNASRQSPDDSDLFASDVTTKTNTTLPIKKKTEILQKPSEEKTIVKSDPVESIKKHEDSKTIDQIQKKPEILHKPHISNTSSEKNIPVVNKDVSISDNLFESISDKDSAEPAKIYKENKASVQLPKKPDIPNKPDDSNIPIKPKKNVINESNEDQKNNKPNINLSNGLFDDVPPPLDDANTNESDNIFGQDDDDLFSSFAPTKTVKYDDKSTSSGLFDNVYDNERKVDLFSDEPPDYTSQTIDNNSANDYSDIYADYPYYKTVNHVETAKKTTTIETSKVSNNVTVDSAEKSHVNATINTKVKKDLFYDSDDDLFDTSKKNQINNKKSTLFDDMSDDDNSSLCVNKPSISKPSITTSLPPINRNVIDDTSKPSIQAKPKPQIKDEINSEISINDVKPATTEETDGLLFSKPPTIPKEAEIKSPQKKIGKLNMNLNINVQALMPGMNITVKEIDKSTKKFETEASDVGNDDSNSLFDSSNSFDESIATDESITLSNSLLKDRVKIQVKRRPPTRKARHDAARKSAADIYNLNSQQESEKSIKTEFIHSLPNSPVKQNKPIDTVNPAKQEIVVDKQDSVPKTEIKPIKKEPVIKITDDKKKKKIGDLFSDSDNDSDLLNSPQDTDKSIKHSLPESLIKEQNKPIDTKIAAKQVINVDKPVKKEPVVKMTEDKTKGPIKKKKIGDLFSDSDNDSDLLNSPQDTEKSIKHSLPESLTKTPNKPMDTKIPAKHVDKPVKKEPVVKMTDDKTKGAIKKKTVGDLFSDSDSDSDLFVTKAKSNPPKKSAENKKDLFKTDKNKNESIFDDADDLFATPKNINQASKAKKTSGIFDDDSDDEFNIFNTKKESKPSVSENIKVNQAPKTKVKTSDAEISFKDPLSSFLDD